ncbi:hypothetical protein [Paenibacillus rhizoplanae]|uniref:hypothetical protein n=1 Tax=Paenibacillus rhizoplanae TaxID=1917181 RepID=UPI00361189A9
MWLFTGKIASRASLARPHYGDSPRRDERGLFAVARIVGHWMVCALFAVARIVGHWIVRALSAVANQM